MSLLKQLFLAICLFLVVAFSGSFVSSVENSREQLRGQLLRESEINQKGKARKLWDIEEGKGI